MAATSTTEKVFRDLLCEGRALPAETTDPAGARTIDELRKQVKELKAELEGERVKSRELVRDHEKDLRTLHDESERKLETTIDSLTVRKDQERAAEVKKAEERLEKQKESELRLLAKDHVEEMRRLQRKLQHEKEEGIRLAVEEERRHYSEEFLHVLPEEEVMAREARLTKELFVLGEQNERLEEQVKNLTRENKTQIELLRRMKHEYSVEVESVVKQNKIEASREMAQLQLAERIIAEKEHELHEVVAKADQFMIEKEFLEEELATVKTSMNISGVSADLNVTTSNSSPPTTTRRSVGGTTGVMQRKMEELEGLIKKLEEDKAELKQENASLRKKLVQQQGGVASVTITEAKGSQDNIVKLRKRNADLMTLTKKLDERCTALKLENEQLRKQDSSPQDLEQQVRKAVARQHTRDIQEYMKQIHSKDKELSELKRKLAKFEVASPSRSDSAPELEKKMRSMAMEKLRMEKLIDKLYSKLPDVVEDVGVSNSELEAESHRAEMLTQENASLKSQLEELHHRLSGGEEVDAPPNVKEQLKQLERECEALRESKQVLEQRNSDMEQRCHELSQKLKVSELNVKELEECGRLEEELRKATSRLKETEERAHQQEQDLQELSVTLKERDGTIELLLVDKDGLEVKVHERDSEIHSLRETLKEVQASHTKPDVVDASIQATPTKPRSLEAGVQATPPSQHRIDAAIQTEPHLLNERAKVETAVSGELEQQSTPSEHPQQPQARSFAQTDPVEMKQPESFRTSAVPEPATTSLLPTQDGSLASEMRGAGVEVHDPYDSSECVAFSDSNPDEVPDSTHSLDSFKSDRLRDDSPRRHHPADEGQSAKPAIPVASLATPQQLSSIVAERSGTGGTEKVNLDLQEEESLSDEQLSNISESDLQQGKQQGSAMMDGREVGVAGPSPSVFIVKYSYDPSTMSPNLNHDLELPLVAGDYIYVFGEADGDGFYHAQLTTGEEGLAPSNFIEMVADDGDEESLSPVNPPQKPDRQRRHSQLQDITEEEEDLSSGEPLAPPWEIELDRQFVEGDGYGVALSWRPPSPLPPSATGYNVYVNSELMSNVEGADQTSVIISGVPRKQLVKITVHTVSDEGESPAPSKPIVLNPQYPDPPSNVEVSEADKSLLVSWDHRPSLPDGNTATSFAIYVNSEKCYQVPSSLSPSCTSQCVEILPKDLKHLDEDLMVDSSVQLTVRAITGHHESRGSQPILLSRKQVSLLLGQHSQMLGSGESSSSEVSVSSSEEEKKTYSPAKLESEGSHVTTRRDHVTISNDHMTVVDHVTNGIEEASHVGQGPVRYYRALYDYDPFYHSPNEEDIEEELAFKAGDIITAHGGVGEDGFLEGELRGKVGFAPSNMLEEITDEGELAQVDSLIRSQSSQNGRDQFSAGGDGSVTKMRAVYDYDPVQDSPNSESGSEVELAFTEGDILTVFGRPDDDGFFQAELGGKRGLVPSNFLEDLKVHRNDGSVEVFAGDEEALRRAEEIIQKASLASTVSDGERNKKSSSILSRGKGLLSSLKDRNNS